MAHYYVNKNAQANGDHEVHVSICTFCPKEENSIYLGEHISCETAVIEARTHYQQVNGCTFCSPRCHTQ